MPLLAFSLRIPLPGLSYHVCHHAQLLGGIMDEEVFMSQGQHRPNDERTGGNTAKMGEERKVAWCTCICTTPHVIL